MKLLDLNSQTEFEAEFRIHVNLLEISEGRQLAIEGKAAIKLIQKYL
jgi:hypothetical protein